MFIILLIGLFIRLSFAFLPGFKVDVDAWFAWAVRLNEVGFGNFYSDQIWTNYTPGFLYVLAFLGWLRNLLNIPDNAFYFLLKLPAIVSEILLGLLAYRIVLLKSGPKWGLTTLVLIIFNPSFIFNNAVWGQIDGVLSLAFLIFVYFLVQKRFDLASTFYGLSFLIKPQAVALMPVLGLNLAQNFKFKNVISSLIPALVIILILSFPFFTTSSVFEVVYLFKKMAGDYPFTSLYAYNFWGIFGFWLNDLSLWGSLNLKNWGVLLFSFCWLVISCFYFRNRVPLYALSALATLTFFFLPTRVHERYLYPALLFLIISGGLFRSKLLLGLTSLLSLIHLSNLYFVYIHYNYSYLHITENSSLFSLYKVLHDSGKMLSLVSVFLFIAISFLIIKLSYAKKYKS